MSLSLFFQSATVSDGGKSQFLMYIFISFIKCSHCESVYAIDSLRRDVSLFFPVRWGRVLPSADLGELSMASWWPRHEFWKPFTAETCYESDLERVEPLRPSGRRPQHVWSHTCADTSKRRLCNRQAQISELLPNLSNSGNSGETQVQHAPFLGKARRVR